MLHNAKCVQSYSTHLFTVVVESMCALSTPIRLKPSWLLDTTNALFIDVAGRVVKMGDSYTPVPEAEGMLRSDGFANSTSSGTYRVNMNVYKEYYA